MNMHTTADLDATPAPDQTVGDGLRWRRDVTAMPARLTNTSASVAGSGTWLGLGTGVMAPGAAAALASKVGELDRAAASTAYQYALLAPLQPTLPTFASAPITTWPLAEKIPPQDVFGPVTLVFAPMVT